MPDLAICFDASGGTDTERMADRLAGILNTGHESIAAAREVDPHVAAVHLRKPFSFAPEKTVHHDGAWLMLDGKLISYGSEERIDQPEKRTRILEQLLKDILSGRKERLQALNGQFNAVAYRPEAGKLIVVTDRLGSRPLYHGTVGGRHVVASELKAVCAALERMSGLDPVGVLEFFAFGHNVGNRTVLEGIQVLPPGEVVTIDESGLRTAAYFNYRYRVDDSIRSAAEAGERIADSVKSAAPDYLDRNGRDGIFLSGGLDSRIIAGALKDPQTPVNAFTFGYPESRDVRYAEQLSGLLGFKHRTLTYPPVYLSNVIRAVVERTECATPFYHTTSLLFHDRITESADRIIVGFCGDVFSGGHLRPSMFRVGPGPELTGMIFERALCADLKSIASIVRPDVWTGHWSVMVDGFSATVTSIQDQSGADTADVWDVENRQRRFTFSAPKVDRGRFEVLAPLLDNRIVDIFLALPAWARKRQRAYRHAIVNGFPGLREVPWTATGRPIPSGSLHSRMQEGLCFASKAFRVAMARLGLGSGSLEWQFRDLAEEIRRDRALFDDHLSPFLHSPLFPEHLLDRQGILDLVSRHQSGRVDASHLLGCLLTLAVFMDLCVQWQHEG